MAGISGFTNVDAHDPAAYIAYLDANAERAKGDKSASFAAQGIGSGMRVLDVGCGTGDDVRTIAQIVGADGFVAGIDTSRALIDEAQRRGVPSNASIAVASAYELPFDDAYFDACRGDRVFQHLERPEEAARELRRVVKPEGSVLLLDQDWETVAIAGGEKDLTRRIVRALVDSLANGWAGRNNSGVLRRAGFSDVAVAGAVNTLPLAQAFAFVLESAVASALQSEAISPEESRSWLASLLEANQRGEFFYGVCVFVTLAR